MYSMNETTTPAIPRLKRFEISISAVEFEFLRKSIGGCRVFGSTTAKQIGRQRHEAGSGQTIADIADEFGQSPLVVNDDDPATDIRCRFGEIGRRSAPVSIRGDSVILDVNALSPDRHPSISS